MNIKELKFKLEFTIKLVKDERRPDLLADVFLKFIDEHERIFTVNGFAIRKSKYNDKPYYLTPPSRRISDNKFFKYVLAEKSLWKEIEKEVISQYEYEEIPVIDK